MLMILSPAKTLDYETPLKVRKHSVPAFLDESQELIESLRKLQPADLRTMMGISDKLAGLNAARFADWHQPFDLDNARQAMYAFQGDVYVGMQAETFDAADREFAQKHLRILSGLYGMLRPLDLMQPYRLEMGTRFENARGADLYDFWKETVTNALRAEFAKQRTPCLLNLASQEYFRAIDRSALEVPVITPAFRDFSKGKYKIISFYAKKARGMMAAWVIRNRIDDPDQLPGFDVAGYRYSASDSKPEQPVFLRKEPA